MENTYSEKLIEELKTIDSFTSGINWVESQHRNTNHKYDGYIDYVFHLRMADGVFKKFDYLIPVRFHSLIRLCVRGHDTEEDCRVTFNDLKEHLGDQAAEIIHAVTNEKGKSRSERANDKYYEGVRNTEFAVFVKLCDRIANVQYSKWMGSKMYDTYKKENLNFMKKLTKENDNRYDDMFEYLQTLFT